MELALLLLLQQALAAGHITPSAPILLSTSRQDSVPVYLLSFMLQTPLSQGQTLLVKTKSLTSVRVGSCYLGFSFADCESLSNPTPAITLPSLPAEHANSESVVIVVPTALAANTVYNLQLILQNANPSTGSFSGLLELYSYDDSGNLLDFNYNFGQVQFAGLGPILTVAEVNANAVSKAACGGLYTISLNIKHLVAISTPLTTLRIALDSEYSFSTNSQVSSANNANFAISPTPALLSAPVLLSATVTSPNLVTVVLNEAAVLNREYVLSITNIKNPVRPTSGNLKVYVSNFNSVIPLQSGQTIGLATTASSLTCAVALGSGTAGAASYVGFYFNQRQAATVTCSSTTALPAGLTLTYTFSSGKLVQGSAFLQGYPSVTYAYNSDSSLTISGLPLINPSTSFVLRFRIQQPASGVPTVSIAGTFSTTRTTLLGQTLTSSYTLFTGSTTFPAQLTASLAGGVTVTPSGVQGVVVSGSSLVLSFTGSASSGVGSMFDFVLPQWVSGTPSCSFSNPTLSVNYNFPSCNMVSGSGFVSFSLQSGLSQNLFVNNLISVTVSGLSFTRGSSLYGASFELYYALYFNSLQTSSVQGVTSLTVLAARNLLAGFTPYLVNDVAGTSAFPNFLRLVSSSPFTYAVTSTQKRIIQVRASLGLSSTLTLTNQGKYPCASALAITCTFLKGAQASQLVATEQLGWDRVLIVLPGSESSVSGFQVVIPDFYTSITSVLYEIATGYIDSGTGEVTYLQNGNAPVSGANTFFVPISTIRPSSSSNIIYIGGHSAAISNDVQMAVTSMAGYVGITGSAAIVVVAQWPLFWTGWSTNYTFPGGLPQNAVVSLSYTSSGTTYWAGIIPIYSASALTLLQVGLNGVLSPFSSDLPYYNIYLTSSTGTMDSFYQYANAFPASFYQNTLASLAVSCNSQAQLSVSVSCTVTFTTNSILLPNAVVKLSATGLTIYTDLCSLTAGGTALPAVCVSSVDGQTLTLTLSHSDYLLAGTNFVLNVFGVSFTASYPSLALSLCDQSGTYVLQAGSFIIPTTPAKTTAVVVNSLALSMLNPLSLTELTINFTLPRPLFADEVLAIGLGWDFSNVNTNPLYFKVTLTSGGVLQPSSFSFSNFLILLKTAALPQGTYIATVGGLIAPASTAAQISVVFQRKYDSFTSLANRLAATPSYPALLPAVTSTISLTSSTGTTEGVPSDLTFTVVLPSSALLNSNSTIFVRLPSYYSVNGWPTSAGYCEVLGTPTTCSSSSTSPFTLQLTSLPVTVTSGNTFTFSVFGITSPQATRAAASSQKFFVGVKCAPEDKSYCVYANVNPPTVSAVSGVGLIRLLSVTTTNSNSLGSGLYTFLLSSSVAVGSGQTVSLQLPAEFDSLNSQALTVSQSLAGVTNTSTSSAPVLGTRLTVTMAMVITANTQFQITVQSLKNPSTVVTVSMSAVAVTQLSAVGAVLATSSPFANTAGTLAFTALSSYLRINNDQPILLTYGTISGPVRVEPSSGGTFSTNMRLSFQAAGLTFYPTTLNIEIGSTVAYFQVGGDTNLLLRFFSYNITKVEQSNTNNYQLPARLLIQVTDAPQPVTLPSTLTIPLGGCSPPLAVTLPVRPFSSLTINYNYDSARYNQTLFFVNQVSSSYNLYFTPNVSTQYLSFCAGPAFPVASPLTLTYALAGQQSASYVLSSPSLVITVTAQQQTAPELSLSAGTPQRQTLALTATVSTSGSLYYHFFTTQNNTVLSLVDIQLLIKSQNLTLVGGGLPMGSTVKSRTEDSRVGLLTVAAGANPLGLSSLYPGKNYTFCGYLLSQFQASKGPVCLNFTTADWGSISKALFTFSANITAQQMNSLLCYLTRKVKAQAKYLLNSLSASCSFSDSPSLLQYTYSGLTADHSPNVTAVYLVSDPTLSIDPAQTSFAALFDSASNALTANTLNDMLLTSSINFVAAGTLQPSITHSLAVPYSVKVNATTGNPLVNIVSSVQVLLGGITLSEPGSYYMVFSREKYFNQGTSEEDTSIYIRKNPVPSPTNVLQCLDYYGLRADACGRVVVVRTQPVWINFPTLQNNSLYRVFVVQTNEYPLFPSSSLLVNNFTILTSHRRLLLVLLILLPALL